MVRCGTMRTNEGVGEGTVNDDLKFGLTVLAVLAALILAATKAMGMDLGISDLVAQLVQLATDLLHRLFH